MTREVVWDHAAVELRGAASATVARARAEGRLEPWTGWDSHSRCGGLIGVVAEAFGPGIVSVSGVPADLLWLAEWVFDLTEDGAWVERFWELVEEKGVRAGAAWRVAEAVTSRWGEMEEEVEVARMLEAAGHGVSEEVLGAVEAVLGYVVLGVQRMPTAWVRHITALRNVSPVQVAELIEQELKQVVL